MHDLRADTTGGVNLQQQRVADSAINNVYLAYAFVQCFETRFNLGDHPSADSALGDQLSSFRFGELMD